MSAPVIAADAEAPQIVGAKASGPSTSGRFITAGIVIAVLMFLGLVYFLSDDVKNWSSKQRGGRRLPTQTLIMLAFILCLPLLSIVWTSKLFVWFLFYLLFLACTLFVFHDTPIMLTKTIPLDIISGVVLIALFGISLYLGAGSTQMFCALVVFVVEIVMRRPISAPWSSSSPSTPPTSSST